MLTLLFYTKSLLSVLVFVSPFVCLFVHHRHKSVTKIKAAVIITLLVYILALLSAWATDSYLQAVLYSFDVNGDGNFGGDEISPAQNQALMAVVNDSARRLAPITALFFAPVYTAMCCGVYWLGLKFGRWSATD